MQFGGGAGQYGLGHFECRVEVSVVGGCFRKSRSVTGERFQIERNESAGARRCGSFHHRRTVSLAGLLINAAVSVVEGVVRVRSVVLEWSAPASLRPAGVFADRV